MRSSASMGMLLSAAIVRNRGRGGGTGCSAIACNYYRSATACRRQNAEFRMKKGILPALFLLILHPAFCVLHASSSEFQPALPGYEFSFPRDHGSHDAYRTEWWYYTGHLHTDNGRRYGFEVTFFRVGVMPPDGADSRWDLHNLALAHFAITDVDRRQFRYAEKLNRNSPFTAGAAADFLNVFNEGWSATTLADGSWHILA